MTFKIRKYNNLTHETMTMTFEANNFSIGQYCVCIRHPSKNLINYCKCFLEITEFDFYSDFITIKETQNISIIKEEK